MSRWLPVCLLTLATSLAFAEEPSVSEKAVQEAEPVVAPMPPGIGLAPIAVNRTLEVLPKGTPSEELQREQLRVAGELLGEWEIKLAGVLVTGETLTLLADLSLDAPIEVILREQLKRPTDCADFILLLDDVLVAGAAGRRGEPFDIGAGRMRRMGALIHPDEIFKGKTKAYPVGKKELDVDTPAPPKSFEPAPDGSVLGPAWSARYPNPTERHELMRILAQARPDSDFMARMESLTRQLEYQGAEHWVTSTVRSKHRGYLMWGGFVLSKCKVESCVAEQVAMLDDRNQGWGLNVDIVWTDPAGWQATVEKARQMKDAYDVVFATENGARRSNHYGGSSMDLVALGLPQSVHLDAPDGESMDFDLSGVEHTRDLSMEPEIIAWVETHFALRKLKSDYPHWNDAR